MAKQKTVQEFIRDNMRHLCATGSILTTIIRLMREEDDPQVIPLMMQLVIAEDAMVQLLASAGVKQSDVDEVLNEMNREMDMIESLRAQ